MVKKLHIYKVKDKGEKHYVDKGILPNLPMKMMVIGKSHLSGKTNFITNILLNKDFFRNNFLGEDIFLVSPSIGTDAKLDLLSTELSIPQSNLMNEFDEEKLEVLYDILEEDYKEDVKNKKKVSQKLIYFDDLGFTGDMKKVRDGGIINKIVMNGRHICLSSIFCLQSMKQALKSVRENVNCLVVFDMNNKQIEELEEEHNYLPNGNKITSKQAFKSLFQQTAGEKPHSFLVINYTNLKKDRYMNSNFQPICVCKGKKKCDNVNLEKNIYEK